MQTTPTMQYGLRAVAGGGRSSARETASRVVGGSIARQLLNTAKIEISAYVERVGDLSVPFTPILQQDNCRLKHSQMPFRGNRK